MATRSVAYSVYLDRIQALMGWAALTDNENALMGEYFNRNIKAAWESYYWPELCPTAQFTPNSSSVVPLDKADNGVDDIDVVLNVWNAAPNGTFPNIEQPFVLGSDGIEFIPVNLPSTVWINYRQRCPNYEGPVWASTTSFLAGQQTYYTNPNTGTSDFYLALSNNANVVPTTTATWQLLQVPYVLFEFSVQASFADALAADGQMTKADDARGYAEIVLARETDKISRQQRQQPKVNIFRTHGTQQLRNAGIGFPY